MNFTLRWLQTSLLALLPLVSASATAAEPIPQYNHDIRPILADNCFACHGPDSAARKADLRLDKREAAVEMKAIVPGKPDESELLSRIASHDADEQMPPPATKKKVTPQQLATLKQWIAAGAEYQPHWSFIAPKRGELPPVKNGGWVRNPIDRFVLARLEQAGFAPAAEADRRTLARRLALDLTGLPPEPALVEIFVQDKSDNAYEKLVDTMLASKQWGEHRARYWLDAARYADTHGIHFDNYREIWAYRDEVIEAFNRNQPFDQFTIEQLAGDLLPSATVWQRIASGFNRCNITTNEGGAIDEEYLVLYTRDRTETAGQVWLGLTVGCAVCHDHKFDPVSQREFYAMSAFFNNTPQKAMDGNVKDTAPVLRVPIPSDRQRLQELEQEIAQAKQELESRRETAQQEFDAWLAARKEDAPAVTLPTEGLYVHASLSEGQGKTALVSVDDHPRQVPLAESISWQPGPMGSKALQPQGGALSLEDVGDFDNKQAFTCSAWIYISPNDSSGSLCARMDNTQGFRGWDFWVQRRQFGTHIVHRWPDNALKVVAAKQAPANAWVHVAVSYDGSNKASGVHVFYDGIEQPTQVEADKLTQAIQTKVPFRVGQRQSSEPLSGTVIQDLRIYKRALPVGEIASLAKGTHFSSILAKPAAERTAAEKEQLYLWWLAAHDKPTQEISAKLARAEKARTDLSSRGTVAYVMQEKPAPPMAHVLHRGAYDQRREQVKPATPQALPPLAEALPRNRLGFAKWLLTPENPLTARVTVNRFWQELFGTGLVRTAGDFGITGEQPSHPELLDWLAVDFRESGWDVKRFFKQMVMSAAYRQSAVATPEKLEKDPANRLLSRGPRFRMDAEMVRDGALSVSGLLVPKIGGPSVKPYQPPGVWEAVAMLESNTHSYKRDSGDSLYRRSMYTFWKRAAPPASMDIFNAPSREACTVRRERTNTPLQALATLNDPQFVEAARALAQRALKEGGATTRERIDYIYLRLLSRTPRDEERAVVEGSLAELMEYYRGHGDEAKKLLAVGESKRDESLDPATHAAWTMLSNQLMNLDEVLNK
ncbi:MAG: DUF1553 domain-containing protein [Planctomycetes bacterium]|nr:DUF1553 domain-containing protein [Planctomycetota bacterium]